MMDNMTTRTTPLLLACILFGCQPHFIDDDETETGTGTDPAMSTSVGSVTVTTTSTVTSATVTTTTMDSSTTEDMSTTGVVDTSTTTGEDTSSTSTTGVEDTTGNDSTSTGVDTEDTTGEDTSTSTTGDEWVPGCAEEDYAGCSDSQALIATCAGNNGTIDQFLDCVDENLQEGTCANLLALLWLDSQECKTLKSEADMFACFTSLDPSKRKVCEGEQCDLVPSPEGEVCASW